MSTVYSGQELKDRLLQAGFSDVHLCTEATTAVSTAWTQKGWSP